MIDNLEIVQSQACIRYLAKRGDLMGKSLIEETKCDMICETCRDLISVVAGAPIVRFRGIGNEVAENVKRMKQKWSRFGLYFEDILSRNGGIFLVGSALTYADVLVSHLLTWFVEECGEEIVSKTPLLVGLQNIVLSLPGIQAFLGSSNYYPLSDDIYCHAVRLVLGPLSDF